MTVDLADRCQVYRAIVVVCGPSLVRLGPAVQQREQERGTVRIWMTGRKLNRPDQPRWVAVSPPDAEGGVLDAERRLAQTTRECVRYCIKHARPDPGGRIAVGRHRVFVGESFEPATRRAEVSGELVPTPVPHGSHLFADGPCCAERVVPVLPLGTHD